MEQRAARLSAAALLGLRAAMLHELRAVHELLKVRHRLRLRLRLRRLRVRAGLRLRLRLRLRARVRVRVRVRVRSCALCTSCSR